MKRLLVLIPDLKMTQNIVQELQKIGIKQENFHIVGKSSDKLRRFHLHEANILQTSDLIPSLKRGSIIGIMLSAILCVAYLYAIPENYKVNPFIIVAILFFGMLFGAWVSSLIGVSVKHPIIEKNKKYISE